jgi:hypothetical protein
LREKNDFTALGTIRNVRKAFQTFVLRQSAFGQGAKGIDIGM